MISTLAALIWLLGVGAFLAIRMPRRRRAAKLAVRENHSDLLDRSLLALCIVSLGILPLVHLATDLLSHADYALHPAQVVAGAVAMAGFVWLFRACHKQIGRNWSVTLELREGHQLITDGLYARMRHPMYTSFFLWAIGQALLLPNWLVGLAGLCAVGLLYALRVWREETMMQQAFGEEYTAYCKATPRLIPRFW